jgi:hypothetical protein
VRIVHLPEHGADTWEIARSLKHKDTHVVTFTGCGAMCPGAIIDGVMPNQSELWLVCWVTFMSSQHQCDRAGIMPLPEGHSGPWPEGKGWEL